MNSQKALRASDVYVNYGELAIRKKFCTEEDIQKVLDAKEADSW